MNLDCYRDALITIHDLLSQNNFLDTGFIDINDFSDALDKKYYSKALIHSSLIALIENGHIRAEISYADDAVEDAMIFGLTPSGASLLEKIKSRGTWDKMLPFLKSVGTSLLESAIEKLLFQIK